MPHALNVIVMGVGDDQVGDVVSINAVIFQRRHGSDKIHHFKPWHGVAACVDEDLSSFCFQIVDDEINGNAHLARAVFKDVMLGKGRATVENGKKLQFLSFLSWNTFIIMFFCEKEKTERYCKTQRFYDWRIFSSSSCHSYK